MDNRRYKKNDDIIWNQSTGFAGTGTTRISCKFIRYTGKQSARIIEDNMSDRTTEHTVRLTSIEPYKLI